MRKWAAQSSSQPAEEILSCGVISLPLISCSTRRARALLEIVNLPACTYKLTKQLV